MVSATDPTPLKANTTKSRQQQQQQQQQQHQHRLFRDAEDEISFGEASLSFSADDEVTEVDKLRRREKAQHRVRVPVPSIALNGTFPDSPMRTLSFEPSTTSTHSRPRSPPNIIRAGGGAAAAAAATGEMSATVEGTPDSTRGDTHANSEEGGTPAAAAPPPPPPPLYQSRRFKGYLTIFLASIINYQAAYLANEPLGITAVRPTMSEILYAEWVSMLSAVVTGVIVLIHLDRYSPLESSLWRPAFSPKSKFESCIIFFLLLWWSVATIVQTSVTGIAGDGKEQYNLYYSTWVCCWTCLWIAERKFVDYGYPTFRSFVTGWPYRAPGWISIFITDFFTLWWYIDCFNNQEVNPDRISEQLVPFYENIPRSQYQWLIFVAAFTLLPSAIFIMAEIVRAGEENNHQQHEPAIVTTSAAAGGGITDSMTSIHGGGRVRASTLTSASDVHSMTAARESSHNLINGSAIRQQKSSRHPDKKSGETIFEGFCLLCLTICWIPSVIAATTPGGFASQVGNAYFFTWATTVFVLETFLWFIHDWRQSVHKALEEKEWEYRQHQQRVLQMTLQRVQVAEARTKEEEEDSDEEESEDEDGDYYYDYDNDADQRSEHGDLDGRNDDDDDRIVSPPRPIHHFQGDDDRGARYAGFKEDHHLKEEESGHHDDDVAEELRLKQANATAYFDTLDDILE